MSKSSSNATHKPAAATLEGPEKGREGHPSNLPAKENRDYIGLPEILSRYYGMWLGSVWATLQDVYEMGAGG